MTYEIPEVNIEGLEKKLKRIKRKCAKYNCDFSYSRVGEEIKEIEVPVEAFEDALTGQIHYRKAKKPVKFIIVDVDGKAVVNGWKFAGSLDHTIHGNIIRNMPGIEIPKRYYDSLPVCEHCKSDRVRINTYIVLNEESGEFKQLGKSCLKDYTGGLSANDVALFESYMKEIEEATEINECGFHGKNYYDVKSYAYCVAECIRHFGYVKNDANSLSTRDMAYRFYAYKNDERLSKEASDWVEQQIAAGKFDYENEESKTVASNVFSWINDIEDDGNYFHNLKVVCASNFVDFYSLGLLASSFPAFDRNLEREQEKEKEAESEYVGKIGERISFEIANAKIVTSFYTEYGTMFINKIIDKNGNVFVWKTGRGIDEDYIGAVIKGTIKEYNEYNSVKQTVLARCKVDKPVKPVKPEKIVEIKYEGSAQEGFDKFMGSLD